MSQDRKTYTFYCYGHPNIKATHFKTLEITKDDSLTERGDCIIGIKADFNIDELKKFDKKIKVVCSITDPATEKTLTSEFKCKRNLDFNSKDELVLRKFKHLDARTYGYHLNRGANWLDRKMVDILKNPEAKMKVTIMEGWKE